MIPNTDLLELSNTSIQRNAQGWIRTNEFLETSVEESMRLEILMVTDSYDIRQTMRRIF